MTDLLDAINSMQQGRVSDPSQDKLYDNDPRYMPSIDPAVKGEVTALPLGDVGDPVSQIAFILAPLLKGFMARQGVASVSQPSLFSSQRGSIPTESGESSLEAMKRIFSARGGKELSEGIGTPRVSPEEFKQGMVEGNTSSLPINNTSDIAKKNPASTIEKAAKTLNDWNSISKEDFAKGIVGEHGSINPKVVDKLWNYFVNEGVIHPNPGNTISNFGMHKVDNAAIRDLLPNLNLR